MAKDNSSKNDWIELKSDESSGPRPYIRMATNIYGRTTITTSDGKTEKILDMRKDHV